MGLRHRVEFTPASAGFKPDLKVAKSQALIEPHAEDELGDVFDHRVEHRRERGGVAADLGQDQPSLVGGELRRGEVLWIRVGSRLAAGVPRSSYVTGATLAADGGATAVFG